MKLSISIATVVLILSSCATSNYGKLQYSKVETKNKNVLTSRQINEKKVTIHKDQKTIQNTDSLTRLALESRIIENKTTKSKVTPTEQKENSSSLRSKLNISKNKIFSELNTIQELNSDNKTQDIEKENNKFSKAAVIMGGLSFIPVFGWIFSILAMIMGGIAIKLYKKYPNRYEGTTRKAMIGITLGIVSLIIGSIIVLFTLILI
ncbi:MAG: hypothetical protein MK105_12110 [Crocinitomicaceae bacterium]|nr:hypothetical protein [Crocinitomicaceae bacterium]